MRTEMLIRQSNALGRKLNEIRAEINEGSSKDLTPRDPSLLLSTGTTITVFVSSGQDLTTTLR